MAAVLQHQVESRVNDLYRKLGAHANLIMRLSVELDRIQSDNEDMREIIRQDRQLLRSLLDRESPPPKNTEFPRDDKPVQEKKKSQVADIATKPNHDNIDEQFETYCNTTAE